MKIAVTYKDNTVFQHFGKTEAFKIYETADRQVVSAEVCGTNGAGHEALADFLAEMGVDVVICGGLGDGAKAALSEAGIEIMSGAAGSCDEAVAAYLKGELVSAGVNCDHHHHEEEEEAEESGCGGHCGGGCSGCGGGCGGGSRLLYDGPNAGKIVRVHYCGTFNDGTQFDSSYDRGEPLEFICAAGMMIPGFDKAVANMQVGEIIDIHLMPEEAYGPRDPQAVFTVAVEDLPGSENLEAGRPVVLTNVAGQQFQVTVVSRTETEITFDANSEMAGKELNFRIELLEVK